MGIAEILSIIQAVGGMIPLLLLGWLFWSRRKHPEAPMTPNERLIAAGVRFSQGYLMDAHAAGKSITDPAVIGRAVDAAARLLSSNYAETADAAGATDDDLGHFAASGAAEAVTKLLPALGKSTA